MLFCAAEASGQGTCLKQRASCPIVSLAEKTCRLRTAQGLLQHSHGVQHDQYHPVRSLPPALFQVTHSHKDAHSCSSARARIGEAGPNQNLSSY